MLSFTAPILSLSVDRLAKRSALSAKEIADLAIGYGIERKPNSITTLTDLQVDGVTIDGFSAFSLGEGFPHLNR